MIEFSSLKYRVEPMRVADLEQVMEIEQVSFTAPWTMHAFDYELHYNEAARYFVARLQVQREPATSHAAGKLSRPFWAKWLEGETPAPMPQEPIVGYSGFWKMVDETHISTIAVSPECRARGIGELLLLAMIDASQQVGAKLVTLEVRKSNGSAQALYRKYRFEIVGERKHYYSDNGEDAWIMTTPEITTASFNAWLRELRGALFARLAA